jgi:hypothetical protein
MRSGTVVVIVSSRLGRSSAGNHPGRPELGWERWRNAGDDADESAGGTAGEFTAEKMPESPVTDDTGAFTVLKVTVTVE